MIKFFSDISAGRWFHPCSPVSSTNKTDRYDIAEILLKVVLNTITIPISNAIIYDKGIVFIVVEEQKTVIQQQFSEQLAELDRQLNDAKREHTKAGTINLFWILQGYYAVYREECNVFYQCVHQFMP